MKVPSLIKWTGTKRSQAAAIASYVPDHDRYIEPFVGSGAALFLMAKPGAIAGDVYLPLIELWRMVQDEPTALADNYRQHWEALHQDLPEYFYKVRKQFNTNPNPTDLNFLLRTCVNGIVRFNDAGQFNNSFHLSRPGMHPDRYRAIVMEWHHRLQCVSFQCQDYADTLAEARSGDFVYLDPPYLGSKQRYIQNIDMERFLQALENLNSRNIRWALSFDGRRGGRELYEPLPKELYRHHLLLESGNSTVGKVLNSSVEMVEESLYLNY